MRFTAFGSSFQMINTQRGHTKVASPWLLGVQIISGEENLLLLFFGVCLLTQVN